MAHMRMKIIPMMPGTKLYALLSCGLYSVEVMTGADPPPPITLSMYATEV